MIFFASVILSISIMIFQYKQSFAIPTMAANLLIFGLFLLQLTALFFQVLSLMKKGGNISYIMIFLGGSIWGAFWSRCVAYSEGISFLNSQAIYIINTIFSAILFGAIYSVISVVYKKAITRYFVN